MRFRSIVCGLVALALLTPQPAVGAALLSAPEQDDRAERERKRNAERAAREAADKTRDYEDTMRDVQDELDEFAASYLVPRHYDDRFLQDYVNELGQSLVPKETAPGVRFSFRVLSDAEPNAFALPDGRIYVNSGLLVFVDNEAQLAAILGHEIAHVIEQHYVESVRVQKRDALIGTVIGAAAGALTGGLFGRGTKAAVDGALIGAASGLIVAKIRMNSYSRKQEDEADSVGVMLALDRKYDAKEVVAFFQRISDTYGERSRFATALFGKHSRNKDRIAFINQLLTGNLSSKYNELRTAGQLTNGTGQMYLYASRMIRDTSIVLMDQYDQFGIAKERLDRIADYRSSDPRTLWALGRVYGLVGRTDAEKAKALDYLQRAAQLDERNMYPYVHRDLGLMQARLGSTPAAVESIKNYLNRFTQRHFVHPPDIEEMYDYLLAFGDRNWTAPAVDPMLIRAMAPAAPAAAPALKPADSKEVPPLPGGAKPTITKPTIRKPEIKKPGGELR